MDSAVLAEKFPKYEQWESGESKPTLKQLGELARKLMTPFGYFFLPNPPKEELPIPDFRTLSDRPMGQPSPNLIETIHAMQRRQDWMHDYLADAGADPLKFVGSVTLQTAVVEAARSIRETLGLFDGWAQEHATWTAALLGLRRAAELAGILVMSNGVVGNNGHRALNPAEFRGFVLCDKLAPLVFLNGADFKSAQMFTLAHELSHLWLGKDGVFNLPDFQPGDSEIEKFCNHVAAETLVPEAEFREYWPLLAHQAEPLKGVARRFKVSPIVGARRALDLGFIDLAGFLRFLRDHEASENRKAAVKPSGGDFYATQDARVGRRFGRAIIQAAKEGKLLYREAYKLTGISGRTFDRCADTWKGGA